MLLPKRTWDGVADGSITIAFRRWKRPTVRAGGTLRSPVGLLDILAVDAIHLDEVTDADARAAGYADRAEALAWLTAKEDGRPYRIRFRRGGQDPRAALAADDHLDDDEVAAIAARLDRKDRGDPRGPWTRPLLRLVADRPGVVARELAVEFGWERDELKRDVRKLKALGLTTSLAVGYELSPRGRAFLAAEGTGAAGSVRIVPADERSILERMVAEGRATRPRAGRRPLGDDPVPYDGPSAEQQIGEERR